MMARLHRAAVPSLIFLAACAHDSRGSCAARGEPPANPAAPVPTVTTPAPAVGPEAVLPPAAAASATSPPSPGAVGASPPLDLNALEQRLRDTDAIGLFTKLSLRNQVDDLLAQFKAFHQGGSRLTLGQLRQKYELLLMRVVSLLQDGDPTLASAVLSSRAAIWGFLTDPQKFAAI